jgi:hypothetical protein
VANLGPSDGVQTLPSSNVDKWNPKNSMLIGGYNNAENVPKATEKATQFNNKSEFL